MNKWVLSIIVSSFFLVGSLLGLSFSVIYGYYPTKASLHTDICYIGNCSYLDNCQGVSNTRKIEEECWLTLFDLTLIYNNETYTKLMSYDRDSSSICNDKTIVCYFTIPDIYDTLTIFELSNLTQPIALMTVFSFLSLTFLLILIFSIYKLKRTPKPNIDYFIRN